MLRTTFKGFAKHYTAFKCIQYKLILVITSSYLFTKQIAIKVNDVLNAIYIYA